MKASYTASLAEKFIAGSVEADCLPTGDELILALAEAYNRGRAIAVGELGREARGGLGLPDFDEILVRSRTAISCAPTRATAESTVRQAVLDCGLAGYAAQLRFSYTARS